MYLLCKINENYEVIENKLFAVVADVLDVDLQNLRCNYRELIMIECDIHVHPVPFSDDGAHKCCNEARYTIALEDGTINVCEYHSNMFGDGFEIKVIAHIHDIKKAIEVENYINEKANTQVDDVIIKNHSIRCRDCDGDYDYKECYLIDGKFYLCLQCYSKKLENEIKNQCLHKID